MERAPAAKALRGAMEHRALNEQEQMQFIHGIFDSSLSRLGPGTEASTLKALDIVKAGQPSPKPAPC